MKPNNPKRLLRLSTRLLKFLIFSMFGFGIACLLAAIFGSFPLIATFCPFLITWLLRLAGFTFCFLAVTVLVESFQ